MKNAFVKIVFTTCILVAVAGCSTNTVSTNQMASETDKLVSALEIENNSLKEKLHSLELDKFQLESQLKEIMKSHSWIVITNPKSDLYRKSLKSALYQ